MQHIQETKKLLIKLAVFYGYDLPDVQLKLFADWLSSRLTLEEIAEGIRLYCEDERNEFFPRPISKIVALARPRLSDEDVGRDVAARIIGAIRRHGRDGWADAQVTIGEVGTVAVQRLGGWRMLCEMATLDNIPTLQAQLRDLAKSVSVQSRMGIVDQPPALSAPAGNRPQLGGSISKIISDLSAQKSLPEVKR